MKLLIKGIETSRELVKKPVLEIGRAIDLAAREAVSNLEIENPGLTR